MLKKDQLCNTHNVTFSADGSHVPSLSSSVVVVAVSQNSTTSLMGVEVNVNGSGKDGVGIGNNKSHCTPKSWTAVFSFWMYINIER